MVDQGPLTPGEPRKGTRRDWTALMYEWARGTESLHAFGKRHKLAPARFMAVVRAQDWRGVKARLQAQAIAKVEPKIADAMAKRYAFQEKQWHTVEGIIARALKKLAATEDITSLAPDVLESLTRTLERTLKSRKLIRNEPTETPSGAAGAPPSPDTLTHAQVVGLIAALANRDPRVVVPESVMEGEVVRSEMEHKDGEHD